MYVLILYQGNILFKELMYNYAWNGKYLRDGSNIASHTHRLRKKIEDDPRKPAYTGTVRGISY